MAYYLQRFRLSGPDTREIGGFFRLTESVEYNIATPKVGTRNTDINGICLLSQLNRAPTHIEPVLFYSWEGEANGEGEGGSKGRCHSKNRRNKSESIKVDSILFSGRGKG